MADKKGKSMLPLGNLCIGLSFLAAKSGGQSKPVGPVKKSVRHSVQDQQTIENTHQPPQTPPSKPSKPKGG